MEYLAARDHSPLELKKKLRKFFSDEEIEEAISEARERRWLPSDEELSERVTRSLNRKKKSQGYIQGYLRARGLPTVKNSDEIEYEKAKTLIDSRYKSRTREDKIKIMRYLKNRGFSLEIIRKVINE